MIVEDEKYAVGISSNVEYRKKKSGQPKEGIGYGWSLNLMRLIIRRIL